MSSFLMATELRGPTATSPDPKWRMRSGRRRLPAARREAAEPGAEGDAAMSAPTPDLFEMPLAFGVDADTGQILPSINAATLASLAHGEKNPDELNQRANPEDISFALTGELDPNDLSQAGWGIVFASNADP